MGMSNSKLPKSNGPGPIKRGPPPSGGLPHVLPCAWCGIKWGKVFFLSNSALPWGWDWEASVGLQVFSHQSRNPTVFTGDNTLRSFQSWAIVPLGRGAGPRNVAHEMGNRFPTQLLEKVENLSFFLPSFPPFLPAPGCPWMRPPRPGSANTKARKAKRSRGRPPPAVPVPFPGGLRFA